MWEIDALRGLLILAVLINHLNITVNEFCINGIYQIDPFAWAEASDPLHLWYTIDQSGVLRSADWVLKLRGSCNNLAVDTFFVLSGLSCVFSRNLLKGGFRLLCGAAFVSLFTWLLAVTTGKEDQFIRFGVLHCYGLCHFIHYFLLEKRSNQTLLIVAAVVLAAGYYLKYQPIYTNSALLVPFGIREYGAVQRDYWPVFPMLGWFLVGVVLGRRFYSQKKSLLPGQSDRKWHRPLCFLGRYSGLIYCGHMVVYTLVFCGIGHIFGLY